MPRGDSSSRKRRASSSRGHSRRRSKSRNSSRRSSSRRERDEKSRSQSRHRRHKRSSKKEQTPRFPSSRNGSTIFFLPSHVYLASSDRIDLVDSNNRRLRSLELKNVDTFATVIGGFSGLNYLLDMEPKRIILFDVNPHAVEYSRLMVQMISVSESHKDFLSRVFSRTIPEDLELSCDTQDKYLKQKFEEELFLDTMSKMTPEARETYNKYLLALVKSDSVTLAPEQPGNCCRLLPCWPYGKYVPVSAGGSTRRDSDGAGDIVPNTNTFYYGIGWLKSKSSFLHVRRLLQRSEVVQKAVDILSEEIEQILVPRLDKTAVVHISNIDDFFVTKWAKRLRSLKKEAIKKGGSITIISATNGVRHYSSHGNIHLPAHDF